jgi:CHAD domain-containing protein
LLRMAIGLSVSETLSTSIKRAEAQDRGIVIVVEGPMAEKDVVSAQRSSDLWHELFETDVSFMTEEQLARAPSVMELGPGMVSLPELSSPGLLPDDPMSEAGRKTLWFHYLRMLKHEPGTRAGEDIEELHDMRVATRRMRAAIRVFGDFFDPEMIKPFNKELRNVARALGPVRDLDVFEEKASHYLETVPMEMRNGLDPLIETWHSERRVARETMITYLDSDHHRKFKRNFGEFLQTEGAAARPVPKDRPIPYLVRHVLPRLVYTRYEAVRAYEPILEDAQVETLHALRIDCKYLRYTLEFFREVLGPEGEAVIEEIKAMQDHLGDLHDAVVAIGLLNDFLRGWDAAQTDVPLSQRRSAEGVVQYLASRHAQKHHLIVTFPEAWERLNRAEVRHWLALAVAAL